jgi:exodeoxyribonuclease VII large subunit
MIVPVLPVGRLTDYVRQVLEDDRLLADVWVEGEVSQAFRAQSGHVYFTLRDDEGQLKCALFRAHAVRQQRLPTPGDQVAAHGHVTLYQRDGAVQLYADVVQPAGLGLAALQLERLRQKLEAEGLFDPSRKRPLPPSPRVIGVVTSADGAVWHDIQQVIGRRYPLAELVLAPTTVQGERAPAAIVAALQAIQDDGRAEVVILARGGGGAEDLWAFNDEQVIRAVFACRVPVVSGVGHETDWTLVDAVADLRAPTPSAAAELCVPSVADLAIRIGEARERLARCAEQVVHAGADDVALLRSRLDRRSPEPAIAARHALVAGLFRRATSRQHAIERESRAKLDAHRATLGALDPRAVLARGYALLHDAGDGTLIGSVTAAAPGRAFHAHLADGVAAGTFGQAVANNADGNRSWTP